MSLDDWSAPDAEERADIERVLQLAGCASPGARRWAEDAVLRGIVDPRPESMRRPDAPACDAPLRRCADCRHDLQSDSLSAAFLCPLFGKPRSGVSLRCERFAPRVDDSQRRRALCAESGLGAQGRGGTAAGAAPENRGNGVKMSPVGGHDLQPAGRSANIRR